MHPNLVSRFTSQFARPTLVYMALRSEGDAGRLGIGREAVSKSSPYRRAFVTVHRFIFMTERIGRKDSDAQVARLRRKPQTCIGSSDTRTICRRPNEN